MVNFESELIIRATLLGGVNAGYRIVIGLMFLTCLELKFSGCDGSQMSFIVRGKTSTGLSSECRKWLIGTLGVFELEN